MEDFTKEELEYIYEAVDSKACIDGKYDDIEPFIDKIQSMIENYCEHYWTSCVNRPWLHCIKCKRNFHHE